MYISNPVLDGATLYGFTSRNKGRLFALDVSTGRQLWASEGRYAHNVQLRLNGRALYALTDTGEFIVNDISSGRPVEKQRHELTKTAVWAPPVFSGRQLFIRDQSSIRAFALP
jgi:outer membrane protein assembly factor BamB